MPVPSAPGNHTFGNMHRTKWNKAQPIELDGRTLEGGGQLIRNALCLSALTGIPVRITDIRGNRSGGGGLKAQHLACVKWLAHACSARIEGAELKSKTLTFEPGKAYGSSRFAEHSPAFKKVMHKSEPVYECRLDIGTAGSTGLALQAILPFILFSELPSRIPIHLTLTGGTNVSGSPSYEYITQVLLPTLQRIGFSKFEATIERRGWSQGGASIGSFTLVILPRESAVLPAFRLSKTPENEDGKRRPAYLKATFIAPLVCHQALRDALPPAIYQAFGQGFAVENGNLEIVCECSGHEKRMYLILVATISPASTEEDSSQNHTLGIDWLYDRKIRSHERTAKEMADTVASKLAKEIASGAAVDYHMRDQLVIFQALARGRSEVYPGEDHDAQLLEPSLHARTAEFVAKKMLKVTFDAEAKCDGAAYGMDESADGALEYKFEELAIE